MSKENAENASGKTDEQKPVNTRELKESEEPVERKSAYSMEAMLEIADTNAKGMSAATKSLKDAWVKFHTENPGMVGENHDEFDLSLMYLAGSIRNDKSTGKADEYLNNDNLPGAIMVKCTSDPRMKIRMPVTFAIAVAHFMRPFIDSIPEAVQYSVALEREINMRKAEVDVFNLGK